MWAPRASCSPMRASERANHQKTPRGSFGWTRSENFFALRKHSRDKYLCQMSTPCMDHRTLKHILAEKSVTAAAVILHVTPRTVYRWCKTHRVARRAYRCPDPQLLHRLEADGTL